MALSDTIGKPLEVFASKTSAEAKATDFTSAHPGALCFTTDGKIVFGGNEVGVKNADDIGISGDLLSNVSDVFPTEPNNVAKVLSSILTDADKLRMMVPNNTLLSIIGGAPGFRTLNNVFTGIANKVYNNADRISTVTDNAAQNLKIHGNMELDGSTSLKHLWSLLGLPDTYNITLLSMLNSLGTYLGNIPVKNISTIYAYDVWVDRGLGVPKEKLSSVLSGLNLSDAREMEFSNDPATYMPNASGLLGSNILYQGVWLGSIIDEMCKKIQAIQNKVK